VNKHGCLKRASHDSGVGNLILNWNVYCWPKVAGYIIGARDHRNYFSRYVDCTHRRRQNLTLNGVR